MNENKVLNEVLNKVLDDSLEIQKKYKELQERFDKLVKHMELVRLERQVEGYMNAVDDMKRLSLTEEMEQALCEMGLNYINRMKVAMEEFE